MIYYPYIAPIILTDAIFTAYGGETGTSSAAQRSAAYTIAEDDVTELIRGFLLPTIITGSVYYFNTDTDSRVVTEYAHIRRILGVVWEDYDGDSTLQENTGYGFIRSDGYGVVDLFRASSLCAGCGSYSSPYKVRLVYETGLPTGTMSNPNYLLGLTMVANLRLKEIVDKYALEGGPGDPGVQQWSSQGYAEIRTKLGRTPLGSSALANQAAKRFERLRVRRAGRMR